MKKTQSNRWLQVICLCWLALSGVFLLPAPAQAQPLLPPDPFLSSYTFEETNWDADGGDAPIAYTNLVRLPLWYGNALWLDTTNTLPRHSPCHRRYHRQHHNHNYGRS